VEVLKGSVIGLGRMDVANYTFLAARLLQFSASVVLVILGKGVMGLLYGAMAAYALMGVGYGAFIARKLGTRSKYFTRFSQSHIKKLLGFGLYMASSNLVSLLMDPFNKVVLARYVGLSQVTYYEIGIKGVQCVRAVYDNAIKAIMPKISELCGQNADLKASVVRLHRRSLRLVLATALPIFSVLFVFAGPALSFWLGDRFSEDTVLALRWFSVGYLINLLSVPGFYALLGLNKSKYCFHAASIRSVAHLAVILCMIQFGFVLTLGIVVAVNTSMMAVAAIFIITMYRWTVAHTALTHT
jgi:O-antigen/teichoic acid export membrane protein